MLQYFTLFHTAPVESKLFVGFFGFPCGFLDSHLGIKQTQGNLKNPMGIPNNTGESKGSQDFELLEASCGKSHPRIPDT